MKSRVLLAELFGTFILTTAVLTSINNPDFPVPTPVMAGLTLGLLVYTIGPISGCHINPAVTVGLFSIGRIKIRDAGAYLVAQFVGAVLAMMLGNVFFNSPAELVVNGAPLTGLAELFGTVLLGFAVASVVIGRVPAKLGGIVIGSGLLLGISFAAHQSNGVLNPAVALGIGSLGHTYVWGPLGGALVGAFVANFFADEKMA
jgi:glycerol uptake facilitator-like aquaporin